MIKFNLHSYAPPGKLGLLLAQNVDLGRGNRVVTNSLLGSWGDLGQKAVGSRQWAVGGRLNAGVARTVIKGLGLIPCGHGKPADLQDRSSLFLFFSGGVFNE